MGSLGADELHVPLGGLERILARGRLLGIFAVPDLELTAADGLGIAREHVDAEILADVLHERVRLHDLGELGVLGVNDHHADLP